VFLGEVLAGQLDQDTSGTTRFQYAQMWLDSPDAVPLSASQPLSQVGETDVPITHQPNYQGCNRGKREACWPPSSIAVNKAPLCKISSMMGHCEVSFNVVKPENLQNA